MKYNIEDIIQIKNEEYIVMDIINHNDNTYLYLINNAINKDDVSIIKVKNNNGIEEFITIEDENEFDYVVSKIFLDYQSEIREILDFESEN